MTTFRNLPKTYMPTFRNLAYLSITHLSITPLASNDVNVRGGNVIKPSLVQSDIENIDCISIYSKSSDTSANFTIGMIGNETGR